MLNKKALAGTAGAPNEYVEDVFSTWLYTGNGSTQTITNGIDLAGKGGMTWIKSRSNAAAHCIFDTARGISKFLNSADTSASTEYTGAGITAFNANGFNLGADYGANNSGWTQASWTFRKAPKFFDVVTFTSTETANQRISHSLGSVPGMIIVKRTNAAGSWFVYHRSEGRGKYLNLNTTGASLTEANFWGTSDPTSTDFGLATNMVAAAGDTLVAYVFAHDAGGFGDAGTDNIISCGSFTASGGNASVTLGWEPQFVIIKDTVNASNWLMVDTMRGNPTLGQSSAFLRANTSDAEGNTNGGVTQPTATGFNATGMNDSTYIYMAIRRPMKTPTSGTEVFSPVAYTGTNVDNRLVNTGIVTDMAMARIRTDSSSIGFVVGDRLRGDAFLGSDVTNAEATDADSLMTPTVGYGNSFSAMNGFGVGNDTTRLLNQSSTSQLAYAFQRRPGFFDVVCYTGTGANTTVTHNLGVVPELMIIKKRSGIEPWGVYSASVGNTAYLRLDTSNTSATLSTVWNNTSPTATVFSVGSNALVNQSGSTYVAYLFASVDGVSKIGSYTGNGSTQTINCGFTSGARFVLIKCVDAAESWIVFDTARGMVSGTSPYLYINDTAQETNNNFVHTTSSGFDIVTTDGAVNTSGKTYIYLAIA